MLLGHVPLAVPDFAVSAAVVEGIDSQPVPRAVATDPFTRPSPYTGVDAFFSVRSADREGNSHDLRLLGRGMFYTPISSGFSSNDYAGALSYLATVAISKRARMVARIEGSLGTTRGFRATDAALLVLDAFSRRRVFARQVAGATFTEDVSPRVTLVQDATLTFGQTLADEPVGSSAPSAPATFDNASASSRFNALYRLDARNTLDTQLLVERSRLVTLINLQRPLDPPPGPTDSLSASLTTGIRRALDPSTIGFVSVGVMALVSPIGSDVVPRPTGLASIIHATRRGSLTAQVAYAMSVTDPRIGLGPALLGSLRYLDRPITRGPFSDLAVVVDANGSYTTIIGGPNDGQRIGSAGGGLSLRWPLFDALGLVAGYEARYSAAEGPGAPPGYFRQVGYIGVGAAWSSRGANVATSLARAPAVAP